MIPGLPVPWKFAASNQSDWAFALGTFVSNAASNVNALSVITFIPLLPPYSVCDGWFESVLHLITEFSTSVLSKLVTVQIESF